MLSKQAEGGLFSQQAKRPCLETSIGQSLNLSTENKLLQGTGVSYTAKSMSLASQRRQELLSNLTIYRDQKLAQKIKLDLSNPLLLKTNTNNAILSTIQTGHQSNVGNLNITSKTSTAFKHLPQRITSQTIALGSNSNAHALQIQQEGEGPKDEDSPSSEMLDPIIGEEMDALFNTTELLTDKGLLDTTSKFKEVSVAKAESRQKLEKDRFMLKETLTRFVTVSLVGNPNLEMPTDVKRIRILELCEKVAAFDPEFILKLVLYCRHELNVRSTSHLLLAFASLHKPCRPFLRRYFAKAIVLPTDWTAVADHVQTFIAANSDLKPGSLPAILRKCMGEKFAEFDQYQLGKHGKKMKKNKIPIDFFGASKDDSDQEVIGELFDDTSEGDEEEMSTSTDVSEIPQLPARSIDLAQKRFSVKRLIRLLHIKEPVFHVMAILEKKYPNDREEFRSSRLPGEFDPEKAGKRIKLPSPITWETQISKHGNKAHIWHELIDQKKLPYMATLRNLRNLLLSGIDPAHLSKVCSYLKNEKAVCSSRLFPYRFFTAFDVLSELREFADKELQEPNKKLAGGHKDLKIKKIVLSNLKEKQKQMCDEDSLKKVEKALNEAINMATKKNIPPLKGSTLLLVSIGNEMKMSKMASKSSSKKITSALGWDFVEKILHSL